MNLHKSGGKTSRHWRAMNGFAGQSPPKNRRREKIISRGQSQSFWKANAGLVVGPAASIVEISSGSNFLRQPAELRRGHDLQIPQLVLLFAL